MALNTAVLISRIDSLLSIKPPSNRSGPETHAAIVEAMQGTLTLARTVYGTDDETPQVQIVMKAAQKAREMPGWNMADAFTEHVLPAVQGSLRAMRADVEAGLVGSIERRATGEVLADMLALAKEALADRREGTRNVAAVLTAAAYEDTIRKIGATLAGVQGRPDLADVLIALKSAKVLTGAPAVTAQSYLKFRNDALHADWAALNDALVGSCIAFVEGLVLQHLS